MPLFQYGDRINKIHSHGLLVLLGLAMMSFIPAFLAYLAFIGSFGLLIGSLLFVLFCWIVLEIILHFIFKKFSYEARQGGTRRRANIKKVKSKYAPRK